MKNQDIFTTISIDDDKDIEISFVKDSIEIVFPQPRNVYNSDLILGDLVNIYGCDGAMFCVTALLPFKAKFNEREHECIVMGCGDKFLASDNFYVESFYGENLIKDIFANFGCSEELAHDVSKALQKKPRHLGELEPVEEHERKAINSVSHLNFTSKIENFIDDNKLLQDNIKIALSNHLGIEIFEKMFEDFHPQMHGEPEEKLPAIREFLEEHKDEIRWAEDFLEKYTPEKIENLIKSLNKNLKRERNQFQTLEL